MPRKLTVDDVTSALNSVLLSLKPELLKLNCPIFYDDFKFFLMIKKLNLHEFKCIKQHFSLPQKK